jgi:hypothetical protein
MLTLIASFEELPQIALVSTPFQEGRMSNFIGSTLKKVMALGLAAGVMTAATLPARAGDGGAIAAGIIGGTALGVLVGATVAHPPPPPPAYYPPPPPPPVYYDPASADGPPPGPGPDEDGPEPGPRCAKWRARPDANGNPVCLHYFRD